MFCPECKTGYQDGFSKCADCGVALVDRLPIEEVEEDVELVSVATMSDQEKVAVMKSLLESHGIPFIAKGDMALSRARGPFVTFQVAKKFAEKASELLKDF
jgi:hypothetical protein